MRFYPFIDKLLSDSIRCNASDIHINPFNDHVDIDLRVYGNKTTVMKIEGIAKEELFEDFYSYFKLKLGVSTPQDQSYVKDNVSFRIATLYSQYGNRLAIRLLHQDKNFNLHDLGYSNDQIDIFLDIIKEESGIIFLSGSTGSGKSTLLYALLNLINRNRRSVISVEDPIEYKIDKVIQIGINENFSFANAMRTILRHDPDVIMLGEIRDTETAKLALEASITGHLILTTLHADSIEAIPKRLHSLIPDEKLVIEQTLLYANQRLVPKLKNDECIGVMPKLDLMFGPKFRKKRC